MNSSETVYRFMFADCLQATEQFLFAKSLSTVESYEQFMNSALVPVSDFAKNSQTILAYEQLINKHSNFCLWAFHEQCNPENS